MVQDGILTRHGDVGREVESNRSEARCSRQRDQRWTAVTIICEGKTTPEKRRIERFDGEMIRGEAC